VNATFLLRLAPAFLEPSACTYISKYTVAADIALAAV
jgi:hypothetical protein